LEAAAYWEAQSPARKAEIDAASLASATQQDLELEHSPFKLHMQKVRRIRYIQQFILATRTDAADA
jgi:hypothetical protein